MDAPRRGGVVLRVGDELRFVPASVAVRLAPAPRITPVPGAPPELLGIALHEGAIVPVVAVGEARDDMVVCQHAGELVGLVGGQVVKTGAFDTASERPDLVLLDGTPVRPLDVATLYARVQSGARPGRWGG